VYVRRTILVVNVLFYSIHVRLTAVTGMKMSAACINGD
jgi:hypothetical protein